MSDEGAADFLSTPSLGITISSQFILVGLPVLVIAFNSLSRDHWSKCKLMLIVCSGRSFNSLSRDHWGMQELMWRRGS